MLACVPNGKWICGTVEWRNELELEKEETNELSCATCGWLCKHSPGNRQTYTGHKMPQIPGCSLGNCDAPRKREDAAVAAATDDALLC